MGEEKVVAVGTLYDFCKKSRGEGGPADLQAARGALAYAIYYATRGERAVLPLLKVLREATSDDMIINATGVVRHLVTINETWTERVKIAVQGEKAIPPMVKILKDGDNKAQEEVS